MKRMISLLAAVMLVSSCGTAPRADLLSESRVTSDLNEALDEAQGESAMAHYLIGGAVVVLALCTVVPGAKRGCQKLFISSERFTGGLQKSIDKLKTKKGKLPDDADTKSIDDKITKLQDMKAEAEKSGKNGIFFSVYDKTIGSIVRKIKKSDTSEQNTQAKASETAENADESAAQQSAKGKGDDAKATSDDAEAGKQGESAQQSSKGEGDKANDAGEQSTDQQK